jgi:hypothetical protein
MTIGEMPLVDFNEAIANLEPRNVGAYVVAVGHAFDGIQLYGPFETFDDAFNWRDQAGLVDAELVPVYTNYPV